MCRQQCLLALLALSVGVVQSWDFATTAGNKLEFYTNKTKIHNEGTQYKHLTALAYDAVHNMMLFVDRQNDNASIFSYHLATKKYQSLVRTGSPENIHSIAFDPVHSLLFWTDTLSKSIYYMSLKPGSNNNSAYGNLWLQLTDEIPRGIAVDSCRGYVYWTNTNVAKASIERARFDKSDRKIIISTDIYMPVSIAIDQRSRKLYWADDKEGIHYTIESSDLDGNRDENSTLYKGIEHYPNSLAVSKDNIYWVDLAFKKIWRLPKTYNQNQKPEEFASMNNELPFGIATNYRLQDQIEGIPECSDLGSLTQDAVAINESFNIPPDAGLFCVHGVKVDNKWVCKCSSGYTGDRCDVSVCQNYCFKGDCSVSDGKPTCRCKEGFSGGRCEVDICNGFCLNNGACSLDEQHMPTCHCLTDFEGIRCETEKVPVTTTERTRHNLLPDVNRTVQTSKEAVPTKKTEPESKTETVPKDCNCKNNTTKQSMYASETLSATDGEFVMPTSCNDGWDTIRDPIIIVLGTFCGLLVLACAVLTTKILQLKKRPRIKKRIIVNKNVTPMTARPDQCEITIENCCNMNICETPCFEPRSTIRPTLLDSKPGKEEKKNLISNMEYPDDY